MSVFLLIATGWTITYQSLTDHANYLWVGLVGLSSTTILGITTYLDNGEGHQFHDFSGWPGFFLMVTWLGMYLYFAFKSTVTWKHVPKKAKNFFIKNMCAGTIYFLVFPALYFFTSMAHPYLWHWWFVFGTYASQIYAIIFMLKQFATKNSHYKQISKQGPDLGEIGTNF